MIDTREMLAKVQEMKKNKVTEICFEVNEDLRIFVEKVEYNNPDEQDELAIELRNIDTNDTIEAANCLYVDDDDIEGGLDYIRRCALDIVEELD